MDELVLTPSECVALINQTLEIAYPTILVEGEVGSFKESQGKYIFFDLKDDAVTLGCFMMAWQLRVPIEDGMRVKVLAEPRLTRWGKFSLNIRQVMPVGQGSIKKAFEMLKAKLAAEGLLDEARKRPIPKMPTRIGVVSSTESAGYKDFIKILNQRWGGVTVEVINVQVQGLPAIEQNIGAIAQFNQEAHPVDVLVIIRGGGSADDLAAYNDELLARAIAASRIPTVVGVGHEVDVSLADLVADVRAATPSNAAQLVVPDRHDVQARVASARQAMARHLHSEHTAWQQKVQYAQRHLANALNVEAPRRSLQHHKLRLLAEQKQVLLHAHQQVTAYTRTLRQLDPKLVLSRGYTLVRLPNGTYVESSQNLQSGDKIQIEFATSIVESEVHSVRNKSNKTDV